MVQQRGGKFDVKVALKLTIAVLAAVAFWAEPSYAACPCIALAYCSFVSTTDLIVSGVISKSTLHEEEDSDGDVYYVSEYKLKIDRVYRDEVDFTVPYTPKRIKFTSSGQSIEACRLDLKVGTEYVVGISVAQDGSFSSQVCGVTRAVDNLQDFEIAALEAGGCDYY